MDETLKWVWANAQGITVIPLLLLAIFSLFKGWVIIGNIHEKIVKQLEERYAEKTKECNEWKAMALEGVRAAHSGTRTAEKFADIAQSATQKET